MQIKVTAGQNVIFSRMLDDSKTLNATVAHLMTQPNGDGFVTEIVNNGNTLTFRNSSLDVGALVRKVEGIAMRTKSEVAV